ncbi:MAG: tetratricopeptide repeat protein [Caulobacteraceae bacterium]
MREFWVPIAGLVLALAACDRSEQPVDQAAACLEAEEVEARIAFCTTATENDALSAELRSQALSARAGAYDVAGDVTAALRDYGAALELDQTNASALLGRSRILINSGQLDAAQPLLQRALNIDQSSSANEMMGQISLRRGQFAEAINYFNAALEHEPRSAAALAARARAKQRSGDLEGATQDFDRAIQLDGNLADARAGRCWLDLNQNRELARARSDAEAAVAADPSYIEGQLCRGVLQLREGQWADARTSFEAVLAIESGNPIALFGRGVARRRSGDNDGAEDLNLARDFDRHIGEQFDDLGVETY